MIVVANHPAFAAAAATCMALVMMGPRDSHALTRAVTLRQAKLFSFWGGSSTNSWKNSPFTSAPSSSTFHVLPFSTQQQRRQSRQYSGTSSVSISLSMDLERPHPTLTHGQERLLSRWSASRASPALLSSSNPSRSRTICPAPPHQESPPPSSSNAAAAAAGNVSYFQRFWDAQLQVMGERLVGIRELPVVSRSTGLDMSVVVAQGSSPPKDGSSNSDHRDGSSNRDNNKNLMVTRLFESDEYRYIRMTLLEGTHAQVFTSVWYPRSPHLPILACDLLRFGGRPPATAAGGGNGGEDSSGLSSSSQLNNDTARHVCIVDYQPVVVAVEEEEREAEEVRIHRREIDRRVESIRQQYPGLHGQVSRRFYPEGCPYFSSQMLLGRWQQHNNNNAAADARPRKPADVSSSLSSSSDPAAESPSNCYASARDMVQDVYEGWKEYVDRHVTWSQQQHLQQHESAVHNSNTEDEDEETEGSLLRHHRHAAYDQFSSHHDPAVSMLRRLYGSDWADAYVHEILFPLSRASS